MFALISFIIGIIILFKGAFRLGSRAIAQPKARSIALMLMAPLVIYFCASSLLVYDNMQLGADGTVTINPGAFNDVANTTSIIELISVGGAVVFALLNIYGSPQVGGGTPQSRQQQTAATPARVPDIMTVAEAAAYMRVSENDLLALIDQGKLGAARIGDTYRIARIAIEDFMAQAHP